MFICKDVEMFKDHRELPLSVYPDPILRAPTELMTEPNPELARNMLYTMSRKGGIGLAAPQVGLSLRMFVMLSMIRSVIYNPEILWKSPETVKHSEGCLSIPGKFIAVERPERIEVRYRNEDFKEVTEVLEGMQAICFQHENDHIFSKLILDYEKSS